MFGLVVVVVVSGNAVVSLTRLEKEKKSWLGQDSDRTSMTFANGSNPLANFSLLPGGKCECHVDNRRALSGKEQSCCYLLLNG